MSRVREEARRHGTREGMLRALAATGPVITSAGIILAGTFSVLMALPVTFTFNLGFMVALGTAQAEERTRSGRRRRGKSPRLRGCRRLNDGIEGRAQPARFSSKRPG